MKHRHQWLIVFVLVMIVGCAGQTPQKEAEAPSKKPQKPANAKVAHWVPTSEGCLVYSPNPIPGETIAWSGSCTNGKASGPGEVIWYLNGVATGIYTGEFSKGKPEGRGKYEHLLPPIPVEQLPPFTAEQLLEYNGGNGNPAYVVYNGKVYDVSHSFLWAEGKHQMSHWAGEDLTDSYGRSPHSFENMLAPYPIVGIFVQD